jgi:hypothetical protein
MLAWKIDLTYVGRNAVYHQAPPIFDIANSPGEALGKALERLYDMLTTDEHVIVNLSMNRLSDRVYVYRKFGYRARFVLPYKTTVTRYTITQVSALGTDDPRFTPDAIALLTSAACDANMPPPPL